MLKTVHPKDTARARAEALQCNIDAAQKEIDARQAEGEDMSEYHVNPITALIERVGKIEDRRIL